MKTGLPSVALFAALLGVATVLHWDKFNHQHVSFWTWATLYFTTPFLVVGAWLANRRYQSPPGPDEPRLSPVARAAVGLIGLLALGWGVAMFVAPAAVIGIWPWTLTPLTCRVMGAIFCLGSAGIGVVVDPRWSAVRLMLQVETLMVALMLVAAVRARGELEPGRPLTWLMGVGFVAVLAGSGSLWYSMEVRPRRSTLAAAGAPAGGGVPGATPTS
jgi:hypothetical protein